MLPPAPRNSTSSRPRTPHSLPSSHSHRAKVAAVIIDEIHLLGADRGPTLEVIASRMRFIAANTDRPVRFVGLSTALANARDLGDWLGIPSDSPGLFNFKPSVRPVPLEVHIQVGCSRRLVLYLEKEIEGSIRLSDYHAAGAA